MANRNEELRSRRAQAGAADKRSAGAGVTGGTQGGAEQQRPMQTAKEGSAGMTRRGAGRGGSMMGRMLEDMDRIFAGFGMTPMRSTGVQAVRGQRADDPMRSLWAPEIELFRRNGDLIVRADLPGLKKEDVEVEVENDILTISGVRNHEFEEETDGVYRSERAYGSFYRAIPLPDGIDPDDIKARFEDGVLELRMKMPEEPQRNSRRIRIK